MDSDTGWASVGDLIDALSQGDVPIDFGSIHPTPAAVLGAKLALKLIREEGTTLNPLPVVLAMPWGSIVFWWRTSPQRRIEVISRDEAYEFIDAPTDSRFRRFMSGPPSGDT